MSGKEISEHMRDFGLHLIGEGVKNCVIAPMFQPYLHSIAFANVAHGAEIVLKARIVQEHPLLIFEKIPTKLSSGNISLDLIDLLEKGKSIGFFDLPDRLWAVVNYHINDLNIYYQFGRVRNQIIHFAAPNQEQFSDLALKFAFEIIEPAVSEFWGEYIFKYVDDEPQYLEERLKELAISFVPDKFNGE